MMKIFDVCWVDPEERIFKIRYGLGKRRTVFYKVMVEQDISGCDKCMMVNERRKYRLETLRLLGKRRGPTFCEVCNNFGKHWKLRDFIEENNIGSYCFTYPIINKDDIKNRVGRSWRANI